MFTLILDIPYVNRYYLICEEEYQERMIPTIKQYLENRFSLPFEIIRIEKVTLNQCCKMDMQNVNLMTVVGMSPPFQKGLSTKLLFQDVSFHLICIYIVWTTKQHFSQHSQSTHLQSQKFMTMTCRNVILKKDSLLCNS